jgi:hypothetical protein
MGRLNGLTISGKREVARAAVEPHYLWPAPGSEDTELGVLMELEGLDNSAISKFDRCDISAKPNRQLFYRRLPLRPLASARSRASALQSDAPHSITSSARAGAVTNNSPTTFANLRKPALDLSDVVRQPFTLITASQ